jgi:hypothetical protein
MYHHPVHNWCKGIKEINTFNLSVTSYTESGFEFLNFAIRKALALEGPSRWQVAHSCKIHILLHPKHPCHQSMYLFPSHKLSNIHQHQEELALLPRNIGCIQSTVSSYGSVFCHAKVAIALISCK